LLAQKWGGLFWATSLEKIFGGVKQPGKPATHGRKIIRLE